MKIVEGFYLREIAGETVAVPVGQAAMKYSGLGIMNETGKFIFQLLQTEQTEESLLKAVTEEFEVDDESALADIGEYINTLRNSGVLQE